MGVAAPFLEVEDFVKRLIATGQLVETFDS